MRFLTEATLIACTIGLAAGCGSDEATPEGELDRESNKPVTQIGSSEAAAVAALESLGAKLKRGDDGRVTEVQLQGVELTESILASLPLLTDLRSVLLRDTSVPDAGLVSLGQITTLRNLDLRGSDIGNASLKHLVGLQSLRALRLSGKNNATQVDDDGLQHIARLTSLKALLLDFLFVSEDGLAKLTGLEGLEELYLAGTLVGDESAAVLVQFAKLRKIRLS
ncbi:MAG: hypothetical protein VB861_14445, partial [Planctomycetaceae bacterium]